MHLLFSGLQLLLTLDFYIELYHPVGFTTYNCS